MPMAVKGRLDLGLFLSFFLVGVCSFPQVVPRGAAVVVLVLWYPDLKMTFTHLCKMQIRPWDSATPKTVFPCSILWEL